MSTDSYSNSQSVTWSVESYEIDDNDENDTNEEIKKLDAHKLHRHDIISYKSSIGGDDNENENGLNDINDDTKSDISNPEVKRKLSRNLSDHLHWKKKSNKARYLRNELEKQMESEQWILALSTCKKILDLQAFNFEPLYHFYCGFIYETGFNNYESAERHYRVALQLEQTNDKHIRYYARILRRLERYEQAEHVYEYGLEQHINNQFIRYEYSYLLWLSQKYQGALTQLKYCLDNSSNVHNTAGENVYWLYGRIQSELEQYSESKKYLNRSIQLKPDDVGYRVDYMLYLINNKKYKEAIKYYNIAYQLILNGDGDGESIGNKYKDTFSYIYLQSVYGYLLSYGLHKYKRAEDVFRELLRYNKNNYFEIHFYYGLHLYSMCKEKSTAGNENGNGNENDMKRSLYEFISALVVEDNWAITYYYIALVLYELGEYYSSLDFLNKAYKMNPSIPIIYKNRSQMMSRITKYLDLNIEETEEDVHHLAVNEYKKRNWSYACILFLRLLCINRDNTNYQHNLAMVLYYGFDNMECSEKYFRKSLKSCGSSHPDIIRHYNVLLIKQQRYEEANAYYQILFKIVNKYKYKLSIDDHISFANVTFHLKEYSVAKEHLKIALKSKPNDGFVIGKYAILLQQIGSFNLSFEYFKHSLSFIPNDMEIRYNYSNLLWRMQDYNSAINELKTCLNHINNNIKSNSSKKKHKHLHLMEEKCCILYGIILIEIEQYDIAKEFILRAIELNNEWNNVNINGCVDVRYIAELMLLFVKTKQFSDAYNYYKIALTHTNTNTNTNTSDNNWYLQVIYAIYLSEMGEFEECEVIFNKLLNSSENKTSPSYHIHFYYALHLHYKVNKYTLAKEQYIKAITIEDYWGITYWHFHKLLFKLKQYKSAQTFLKKTFKHFKQIPIINQNYEIQLKLIQNAINNKEKEKERDESGYGHESNKALQAQIHYQYKKRSHPKTKTKTKTKNLNVRRQRRKSNLYASNSNLLDDSSLDNLHKRKKNKKNKKKKRRERKNKLTKDANKMYNNTYNKIHGIETNNKENKSTLQIINSKNKKHKKHEKCKKHKTSKKYKKHRQNQKSDMYNASHTSDMYNANINNNNNRRSNTSHRSHRSHSNTTHSITMISASEEYVSYNDDQSYTKSY